MKAIYLLKQSTNAIGEGKGIAAVATTLEKAIEMLKEWYEEEKEEKGKYEELDCELIIDGKFSYATIQSKESNARIGLDIEEALLNEWLDI